jgi:hypothetical protein
MDQRLADARLHANDTRYHQGSTSGHYESFFVRANHPSRPLAFWIRYTIFSPRNHPEQAMGELWAIAFDGESRQHVAVRSQISLEECSFDPAGLNIQIGGARLERGALSGTAEHGAHVIQWDLRYNGAEPPLFR